MSSTRIMQFATFALVCGVGLSIHVWLAGRVPPGPLLISDILSLLLCGGTLVWVLLFRDWNQRGRAAFDRWFRHILNVFWAGSAYLLGTIFAVGPYVGIAERLLLALYVFFQIAFSALATIRRPVAGTRGLEGALLPVVPAVGLAISFVVYPVPNGAQVLVALTIVTVALLGGREYVQGRINEQYDAMIRAQAERDAQIASKQAFLAAAGHDLDQPLQAARLSFDQALRLSGADRARAVERLDRAFDAMEAMVTQISQHLKLEAGAVTAELRTVSIGQVMSHIASLHEPAALASRVSLHVLPSRLAVRGDSHLIERVLSNFVANALRHAKPQRVLIGARRQGPRVRLWVIDDGVGLATADPAALFEDYTRGDHGGESRGGFGLGLASARRMALLMQGSVGQDPRWTTGAAFYLDLPTI